MKNRTKKTAISSTKFKDLQRIHPNVAGIDIGANSIFVCAGHKHDQLETREYPTFTADLKAMVRWLKECKVKSVAMESTGVYWIPSYDILVESGLEVLLVNARHLKAVPGRKTDVKDCQWLQQLHSYGLLRGSFRPDDQCVALRTYVRQRTRLFESAATQVQLMHKALTQMNLQINQVLSDITGVTGMRILRAIVNGERNPIELAKLRDCRCKHEESEVAKALEGNFRPELVFALKQALEGYDFFHQQTNVCEKQIEQILTNWQIIDEETGQLQAAHEKILPQREEKSKGGRGLQKKRASNKSPYSFDAAASIERILGVNLTEIPGLDANTIVKIVSEIGTDMTRWPTEKHFASWLGLCPGNKISGGKVLSSKSKPTANKAAAALRLAANALYRSKTALGAYFRKMRARLGAPKAITATAHKLARILYHMLKHRKSFQEVGMEEYERQHKARSMMALSRRAKEMGYTLTPIAQPV